MLAAVESDQDQGRWMQLLNQSSIPNAISPKSWGPACWRFLDCLAFSYPLTPSLDQQEKMAAYFHALKHVLPCYSCRRDFTRMMEEDPIERHLHSREALSRWLNDKHNAVNQKLGASVLPYPQYVAEFIGSSSSPTTTIPPAPMIGAQVQAPPLSPPEAPASRNNTMWIVLLAILLGGGLLAAAASRKKKINL